MSGADVGDTDSQDSSPPISSDDAQQPRDDSVSDDECHLYFYDATAARRVAADGSGTSIMNGVSASSNF